MKCISCEVEINPKWTHAIDINVCPFCGSHIMEEHLKNLFVSLRETIDKLKDYPDQLNDWMLSNCNYIKTNSPDISIYAPKCNHKVEDDVPAENKPLKKDNSYTVKIETERGTEEVKVEKVQSQEKTNDFFKRAEAFKPGIDGFKSTQDKTKHLKALAKHIQEQGSGTIEPEMVFEDSEIGGTFDKSSVADLKNLMHEEYGGGEEMSDSSDTYSNGDDDIPAAVLNMAANAKGKQLNGNEAAIKLQELQDKRKSSKQNFNSGGGGFHRA